MNEKEIQEAKILRWLSEHGSIDALTALDKLGIMRLASRICDLRKKGVPITDSWAYKYDAEGRVIKKWKEYKLA